MMRRGVRNLLIIAVTLTFGMMIFGVVYAHY